MTQYVLISFIQDQMKMTDNIVTALNIIFYCSGI